MNIMQYTSQPRTASIPDLAMWTLDLLSINAQTVCQPGASMTHSWLHAAMSK